jgi:hypothetical protein
LLALASPEVEILAITVCFGTPDLQNGFLGMALILWRSRKHRCRKMLVGTFERLLDMNLTHSNNCRGNIIKLFDVLRRHFEENPDDINRFPNFTVAKGIYFAKGSTGPLEGTIQDAEDFHGLYGTLFPN